MSKRGRIKRSMIFLNAHRASLVKDAFVYEPDCVIFDLEDAVAERSKDSGGVRAIESGDIHIDVAFIGAPTSDEYGTARGVGGKSDCGVLSYAEVDAKYAYNVIVITDTLVQTPNFPTSIKGVDVNFNVNIVLGSDGLTQGEAQ